jgi:hypothetical protein
MDEVFYNTVREVVTLTGLKESHIVFTMCVFVLLYILFLYNKWILETAKGPGLAEEIDKIRRSSWVAATSYRRWLENRLALLDGYFGSPPWSARSYVFCVKLALTYTVLSVFLTWVSFGAETLVLRNVLTQSVTEHRIIHFLGFLIMTSCTYIFFSSLRHERWLAFIIAASVPLCKMLIGLEAGAIVMAAVASFSFMFLFYGGKCLWVFSAYGAMFAVTAQILSANEETKDVAATLMLFGLVIGSFGAVVLYGRRRYVRERTAYFAMFVGFIVICTSGVTILNRVAGHDIYGSFLLFMVWLPLINSFFDWISFGATRWLLRLTISGWNAFLVAFVDFLVALVATVVLTIFVVVGIEFFNLLSRHFGTGSNVFHGESAIEVLRKNFTGVQTISDSPSVWWIYIMLFSTLLPSFIHLIGATGAIATFSLPPGWLNWHLRALQNGFEGRPRKLVRHAGFMTLTNVVSTFVWIVALSYLWSLFVVYTNAGWYVASALLFIGDFIVSSLRVM